MKYIILPALKFIWAILLTVIWIILEGWTIFFYFLWNFNVRNYSLIYVQIDSIMNFSSYTEDIIDSAKIHKSYFHYIYGI